MVLWTLPFKSVFVCMSVCFGSDRCCSSARLIIPIEISSWSSHQHFLLEFPRWSGLKVVPWMDESKKGEEVEGGCDDVTLNVSLSPYNGNRSHNTVNNRLAVSIHRALRTCEIGIPCHPHSFFAWFHFLLMWPLTFPVTAAAVEPLSWLAAQDPQVFQTDSIESHNPD